MNGQQVAVVGMINFVRFHQTKKGDPMAFVEIEDIQAAREVVVFPRTFKEHKELLVIGNLIMVTGKIDAQNGGYPKILADTISTEITSFYAVESKSTPQPKPAAKPSTPAPPTQPQSSEQPTRPAPAKTNGNGSQQTGQTQLADTAVAYQTAQPAPLPEPPPPPEPEYKDHWLHITIPRADSLSQDKHRLKTVYDLLTEHPGNDHFSLYIPSGNKTTRVDFPNDTIKDSAQLRQQLVQLLGAGTIREE
jgi:hypothetical protein